MGRWGGAKWRGGGNHGSACHHAHGLLSARLGRRPLVVIAAAISASDWRNTSVPPAAPGLSLCTRNALNHHAMVCVSYQLWTMLPWHFRIFIAELATPVHVAYLRPGYDSTGMLDTLSPLLPRSITENSFSSSWSARGQRLLLRIPVPTPRLLLRLVLESSACCWKSFFIIAAPPCRVGTMR